VQAVPDGPHDDVMDAIASAYHRVALGEPEPEVYGIGGVDIGAKTSLWRGRM